MVENAPDNGMDGLMGVPWWFCCTRAVSEVGHWELERKPQKSEAEKKKIYSTSFPPPPFGGVKKSLKLSVHAHLFQLNLHIPPADRGRGVSCVVKILKRGEKRGILYLEGKFVAWLLDHLCRDQCSNSSLSWNQSHSSNTLTLNEANLFQMERFPKNFTPQTCMRCNQSNLSSSGTVEDTEKHLVRWISFPEVLDLQWDLDTKPKAGGYYCFVVHTSIRFASPARLRYLDFIFFLGVQISLGAEDSVNALVDIWRLCSQPWHTAWQQKG